MPADPIAAGRKGGKSTSQAKIAACRRNGFQPQKPSPELPQETAPQPETDKSQQQHTVPTLFIRRTGDSC